MPTNSPTSANFAFLVAHDRLLDHLGALAERYFSDDPGTCLLKLRQFGEVLAQRTAAGAGLYASTEEKQAELLSRLRDHGLLPREIGDLFHGLRKAGNAAAHDIRGDHREALYQMRMAWQLGVWFHRTFKNGPFKPDSLYLHRIRRPRARHWRRSSSVCATRSPLSRRPPRGTRFDAA